MFYLGVSYPPISKHDEPLVLHYKVSIFRDAYAAVATLNQILALKLMEALAAEMPDIVLNLGHILYELEGLSHELVDGYGAFFHLLDADGKKQCIVLSSKLPTDATYEIISDHSNCTDEGCVL